MFRATEFHASLGELVRREERSGPVEKLGSAAAVGGGLSVGRPQTWPAIEPRQPYFTEEKPFTLSAVVDG